MATSNATALWSAIAAIEASQQLTPVASLDLPEREALLGPVPAALAPRVRRALERLHPAGLYRHQVTALTALVEGRDVCLATPTASGKSLIFLAAGLHRLESEPGSKVLALYPTRALLLDQLGKWTALASKLGATVGRIDGGVPVDARERILADNGIILMTPDVAHAWALAHVGDGRVGRLLAAVRLLVLDEAHIYEGVFGSNMAFFLRRLAAVASNCQRVTATATVGEPADFVERLTGHRPLVVGAEDSGAPSHPRRVTILQPPGRDGLEATASLVARLAAENVGRFLVFADSRRFVEQLCVVTHRLLRGGSGAVEDAATEGAVGDAGEDDGSGPPRPDLRASILPYRAGFEDSDRQEIQEALASGKLRGVISTSALELGLDIGEIRVVVCAGLPWTKKSLLQRLGRAGRSSSSCCLLLDFGKQFKGGEAELAALLDGPVEPNRLYLDNRFLQYAHALCAAREVTALGVDRCRREQLFAGLPASFRRLLDNELDPHEAVPPELYVLKQRCGVGNPHFLFPLRGDGEPSFDVQLRGQQLGTLTYAQALREAYPGAIYLHMAHPYRVQCFRARRGEIEVVRQRGGSTRALVRSRVLPKLPNGLLALHRSAHGFIAEIELQVIEDVYGFLEKRGSRSEAHHYGADSVYSRNKITRFFSTTGVCWSFEDLAAHREELAALLARVLGQRCEIQPRDLGAGAFKSRAGLEGQPAEGGCVYDETFGSLRLSGQLLEHFGEVLAAAQECCEREPELAHLSGLVERLAQHWGECRPVSLDAAGRQTEPQAPGERWVQVIAPGSRAIRINTEPAEEVRVDGVAFGRFGLVYRLECAEGNHLVPHPALLPLVGESEMTWFDLDLGVVCDEPCTESPALLGRAVGH